MLAMAFMQGVGIDGKPGNGCLVVEDDVKGSEFLRDSYIAFRLKYLSNTTVFLLTVVTCIILDIAYHHFNPTASMIPNVIRYGNPLLLAGTMFVFYFFRLWNDKLRFKELEKVYLANRQSAVRFRDIYAVAGVLLGVVALAYYFTMMQTFGLDDLRATLKHYAGYAGVLSTILMFVYHFSAHMISIKELRFIKKGIGE